MKRGSHEQAFQGIDFRLLKLRRDFYNVDRKIKRSWPYKGNTPGRGKSVHRGSKARTGPEWLEINE